MPGVSSVNRYPNPRFGRQACLPLHYQGFAFDALKCRIELDSMRKRNTGNIGRGRTSNLMLETGPVQQTLPIKIFDKTI